MRFTVYSAGIPDPATRETIESLAGVIERWEVILPASQLGQIPSSPVPPAVAPIVPVGGPGHHFVSRGFDPEAEVPDLPYDEVTLRVAWDRPVADSVAAAASAAAREGKRVVINLLLPRNSEAAACSLCADPRGEFLVVQRNLSSGSSARG